MDLAPAVKPRGMHLNNYRTLVLNADYRPLSTAPLSLWGWRDAIEAVFRDRMQVLEEWSGPLIRSQRFSMKVPKVIISNEYIRTNKNRTPALSRFNCALRDRFRCGYCGNSFHEKELTFDHVIPRSKGGKTTWDNILSACGPCNLAKGNEMANYNGIKGVVKKGNFVPLTRPKQPTIDELYKTGIQFIPPHLYEVFGSYLPAPRLASGENAASAALDVMDGPWDPALYWTVELES